MSIVKRGNSYQATVTHRGARFRRQFLSTDEAELWVHEAKAALLRGETPALGEQAKSEVGKPRTLGELLAYTHARHWRGQKSEAKTAANAAAMVKLLGPHLPVKQVDAFRLDRAVIELRESVGNSNATINRKLSALSRMLTVAVDLGIIDRKPKCERFRETEKRLFRFTPEIERKAMEFFNRMDEPAMMGFIKWSLGTGMRCGEVLRLRWSDVVTNDHVVVSETKSGKSRVIPLSTLLQSLVAAQRGNGLERVFPDLDQGKVTRAWQKLRAHLGLLDEPSFTPHLLRHEFCSRLADRGVNAAAIRDLAGHSSLVVTQRYINLSPRALGDAIKALEPA